MDGESVSLLVAQASGLRLGKPEAYPTLFPALLQEFGHQGGPTGLMVGA
jgi:hypothetical protein